VIESFTCKLRRYVELKLFFMKIKNKCFFIFIFICIEFDNEWGESLWHPGGGGFDEGG
jgi:hypothetical protein